jgi:enoyl-CoA hydratase/carnithine racemase
VRVLQEITRRIVESDTIFVAAVNGVAAGFGAELAIACDVRVVARSARFLFPEVRRGLFITNGVSYLLPRLVGRGRAAELLLSGEPIGGEEAHRIGLANRCVDDASCVTDALALAHVVASNAPLSVALTKRILRETADGTLDDAMGREVEYAMACFRSGAHEEGARAFLEKRDPRHTLSPPPAASGT